MLANCGRRAKCAFLRVGRCGAFWDGLERLTVNKMMSQAHKLVSQLAHYSAHDLACTGTAIFVCIQ